MRVSGIRAISCRSPAVYERSGKRRVVGGEDVGGQWTGDGVEEEAGHEVGCPLVEPHVVEQRLLQHHPAVADAVMGPRELAGQRGVARVQDGVGRDDPREAVLVAGQHAEPERAAPVLHDERDVAQVEAR